MADQKVWFITGAGRGMGVEFAKAALAAGNAVVATGRNIDVVSRAVGQADEGRVAQALPHRLAAWLMRWTPVRFDPGWRWHVDCDLWDRKVARLLEPGMECFVGFGGMSLHSFRAARRMGCPRLELIAANTHVDNCFRLHARATQRHPIE